MLFIEPTTDEIREAYKASKLRRRGISLQKVLLTPSTKIALRMAAIVLHKKAQHGQPVPDAPALHSGGRYEPKN